MSKKPKYKYEFLAQDNEIVLLAIGETKVLTSGATVKVHKLSKTTDIMNTLWISYDSGVWTYLESGKRTPNGINRKDFTKWEIDYITNEKKKQIQ